MAALTQEQIRRLREALDRRSALLIEEVRSELERSGDQYYIELAGRVTDSGDEAVADVLADLWAPPSSTGRSTRWPGTSTRRAPPHRGRQLRRMHRLQDGHPDFERLMRLSHRQALLPVSEPAREELRARRHAAALISS